MPPRVGQREGLVQVLQDVTRIPTVESCGSVLVGPQRNPQLFGCADRNRLRDDRDGGQRRHAHARRGCAVTAALRQVRGDLMTSRQQVVQHRAKAAQAARQAHDLLPNGGPVHRIRQCRTALSHGAGENGHRCAGAIHRPRRRNSQQADAIHVKGQHPRSHVAPLPAQRIGQAVGAAPRRCKSMLRQLNV